MNGAGELIFEYHLVRTWWERCGVPEGRRNTDFSVWQGSCEMEDMAFVINSRQNKNGSLCGLRPLSCGV